VGGGPLEGEHSVIRRGGTYLCDVSRSRFEKGPRPLNDEDSSNGGPCTGKEIFSNKKIPAPASDHLRESL